MVHKQFVVIGLGRFGSSVAKTLYSLGNDVLVIDSDEVSVADMTDHSTHAVQVDATDEAALRALGIRNFDVAVVAIGDDVQSSIMVTLLCKEFGIKYVIAKAQNEMHAKVLYKIGADRVVFPEREMGVRVGHNLCSSNILEYIELSPDYSIMEVTLLEEWEGKSLRELSMRSMYGINVMAIKRDNEINISMNADEILQPGDVLVVVGATDDIKRIERRNIR